MDVVSVLSIFAFLLSGVFGLTYNYGDGSYYVGEVDNYGLPKGTGKFYNTSGNLEYHGDFYDGVPHGNGTWYGGDGSVYVGSFRYGRSSGQGVMTYRSGETIVGEFLDMKPHGRVVYEAATSDTDSIPHGDSTLTDKNAPLTVKGQFRHGMAHGNIVILYQVSGELEEEESESETVVIEGTFRMGLPHGIFKISRETSEDEEEEDSTIAEAKFLYGRPLLDGQLKDWRTSEVLRKALRILNRKLVI